MIKRSFRDKLLKIADKIGVERKKKCAAPKRSSLQRNQQNEIDLPPVFLNLGIDFGTRFTKVCYRDVAQEKSAVVHFGANRSDIDEALLPSVILCSGEGELLELSTGFTKKELVDRRKPDDQVISYIKMRLAQFDLHDNETEWLSRNHEVFTSIKSIEAICTFFLAQVIKKTKDAILDRGNGLYSRRQIVWSANVGVPVEYCDSPAIDRFKRVLACAWQLSESLDDRPVLLKHLLSRINHLKNNGTVQEVDCHAIPEIAAGIQSFLTSREAREDIYIFIDIGSGTLDGVSFRYYRRDGEPRVSFFSGKVGPQGVNAVAEKIAFNTGLPPEEVEKSLFNHVIGDVDSDFIVKNAQAELKQIQTLVVKVLKMAKEKDPLGISSDNHSNLKVFIGGGGGKSDFFQNTILSTYNNRQLDRLKIPSFTLKQAPVPEDLAMAGFDEEYFHRFAIAYGLSVPPAEHADYKLPSEIDSVASMNPRPLMLDPGVVPYENSKDCC